MTGIGSIPASEIRQALPGRFLFLSLTVARGAARLKPHSHAARGNEKKLPYRVMSLSDHAF
jgi:hypothetical protein